MAVAWLGSAVTMLPGLLRTVAQIATGPSGLTAVAATMVVGAVLVAIVALLACVAKESRAAASVPVVRRASALRARSWRAAFSRQRDPDGAGRARPRAPSAALAAAITG